MKRDKNMLLLVKKIIELGDDFKSSKQLYDLELFTIMTPRTMRRKFKQLIDKGFITAEKTSKGLTKGVEYRITDINFSDLELYKNKISEG
jgi:hypothetical protein